MEVEERSNGQKPVTKCVQAQTSEFKKVFFVVLWVQDFLNNQPEAVLPNSLLQSPDSKILRSLYYSEIR